MDSSQSADPLLPTDHRPLPPSKSSSRKRPLFFTVCAVLAAASLAGLAFFFLYTRDDILQTVPELHIDSTAYKSAYIQGDPKLRFRDNLRNDTLYMTAWINGGWTNDVMTYANMMYMALLTDRVAILPPFAPSHIGQDAGLFHFGDIFDVPRLSKEMGLPVIEWRDIKDPASKELDHIGCWSIWMVSKPDEKRPRESKIPDRLALDISYTAAPSWIKLFPQYTGDWHLSFWAVASLAYPQTRAEVLKPPTQPIPSEHHGTLLPPDEQVVCYDFPYFMSTVRSFEWSWDFSPAWRYVGKYIRWSKPMQELANGYLRRAFKTPDGEALPPYIAIHARRQDFEGWCQGVPKLECFATLPTYARRVAEVQAELKEKKGLNVTHVLMTSDEPDPNWWQAVKTLGWTTINHTTEGTVDRLGKWYPPILDAVFQSSGIGFIGTDQSTMSLLAQRRVQDWYGGATRNVKWGWIDADLQSST